MNRKLDALMAEIMLQENPRTIQIPISLFLLDTLADSATRVGCVQPWVEALCAGLRQQEGMPASLKHSLMKRVSHDLHSKLELGLEFTS